MTNRFDIFLSENFLSKIEKIRVNCSFEMQIFIAQHSITILVHVKQLVKCSFLKFFWVTNKMTQKICSQKFPCGLLLVKEEIMPHHFSKMETFFLKNSASDF